MPTQILVAEYLERAVEAEKLAAAVTSPSLRADWLKIAEGYRSMAQHHLDRIEPNPLAKPPSTFAYP